MTPSLSDSPAPTTGRRRTVTAYHEAAHAVVALAANWYPGQFVELAPGDRPDLLGVHRVGCRPWEWDQPSQRMEIAVGGFLVDAAGWLAERRLFTITGWDEDGDGAGFTGYNDEDGNPAWFHFYDSELLEQTDPTAAAEWLAKAATTLGLSAPTMAMHREIQAAAADMVIECWQAIEDLARELDKAGKVEDLSRYWPRGSIGTVERLCGKWARRFAHRHPAARELVAKWRAA